MLAVLLLINMVIAPIIFFVFYKRMEVRHRQAEVNHDSEGEEATE